MADENPAEEQVPAEASAEAPAPAEAEAEAGWAPRALLAESEIAAFGSATGAATLRFLSPASA